MQKNCGGILCRSFCCPQGLIFLTEYAILNQIPHNNCEVIIMFEIELLTDSAADAFRFESCVPDCPCQPDQRENECWPYFADDPEQTDAAAE